MKRNNNKFSFTRNFKVSYALYLVLSLIAGALLPVESSINATLLEPTNNQIAPAAISFFFGTLSLALLFFYDPRRNKGIENTRKIYELLQTAPYSALFFPGFVGAFYLTLGAVLGSKLGFSLFFVCIVAGNLVSAAFVDHIGALGLEMRKLNRIRLISIFLVLSGATISVYERITLTDDENVTLPVWKVLLFMLLSIFSGCLFPIQVALNAKLTEHMTSLAHRTALWYFFLGTVYLITATLFSTLLPSVGTLQVSNLKTIHLWKFLGGPLGAMYVSLSIYLGPKIGVSLFLVFAIGGQFITSLIIDRYGLFESTKISITASRIIGILLVFIALIIFQFEKTIQLSFETEEKSSVDRDDKTLYDPESDLKKDIQLS